MDQLGRRLCNYLNLYICEDLLFGDLCGGAGCCPLATQKVAGSETEDIQEGLHHAKKLGNFI